MPDWTHTHWTSGHSELDEEHNKLHQMIASLAAVVRKDVGADLAQQAAEVLKERLSLHFQMEERSATRFDKESAAILAEDHRRLLKLLESVHGAVTAGDKVAAQTAMTRFTDELSKHDQEVDIPLFRMMAPPGVRSH